IVILDGRILIGEGHRNGLAQSVFVLGGKGRRIEPFNPGGKKFGILMANPGRKGARGIGIKSAPVFTCGKTNSQGGSEHEGEVGFDFHGTFTCEGDKLDWSKADELAWKAGLLGANMTFVGERFIFSGLNRVAKRD